MTSRWTLLLPLVPLLILGALGAGRSLHKAEGPRAFQIGAPTAPVSTVALGD